MLLSLLSKRTLEVDSRDSFGFALRPQYIQAYREYTAILKEEETERSEKWNDFLQILEEHIQPGAAEEKYEHELQAEATGCEEETTVEKSSEEKAVDTESNDTTVSGRDSGDKEARGSGFEEIIVSESGRKFDESEATAEIVSPRGNEEEGEAINLKEEIVLDTSGEDTLTRGTEETVTGKYKEEDKGEDIKLKEEIVSEGSEEGNLSEGAGEGIAENAREGDNTGESNLNEEIVSSKSSESSEETASGRGKEVDLGEGTDLKEDFVLEKGEKGNQHKGTEETAHEKHTKEDKCKDDKLEEDSVSGINGEVSKFDDTSETVPVNEIKRNNSEATELKTNTVSEKNEEGNDLIRTTSSDRSTAYDPKNEQISTETRISKLKTWTDIRRSLGAIENLMSVRVKKRDYMKGGQLLNCNDHLSPLHEARLSKEEDPVAAVSPECNFLWKQELESLVHGGVPKDLRGEVWQAFAGVKARRVERYYLDLVAQETNAVPIKYRKQIEKDIPRTFPGHPALNEDGRNSLKRILLAYALHNPSVGYCQAMNYFAGILLLLMPEENAFWTLVGVIDDYFEGCYTEEMIESQVDQLVFEELTRERFPKLVHHLDYLGVQVAWISGPWFLSIFVNTLPWDSVFRVWDVILYEGNRVMLFRTALALMEIYGHSLLRAKDAGEVIISLQSLTGSTFDSSQLVLTACMGYLSVTEDKLQELRRKHRPSVLEVTQERANGGQGWKSSKEIASKLYSFKHDRGSVMEDRKPRVEGDISCSEPPSSNLDEMLNAPNSEVDSVPDLQEQVVWMKVELCRLLEDKRSAILRAEELETALMEMVREDNRLELTARVEELEAEVDDLQEAIADKKEQEFAMLEVLIRLEQEQKLTEDARRSAEQEAVAQKYALHVLEEKYERATASLAEMERRVLMAESMLEATTQYQSGQAKAASSPRAVQNQSATNESPSKKKIGIFGLSWRDRIKGKESTLEKTNSSKSLLENIDSE